MQEYGSVRCTKIGNASGYDKQENCDVKAQRSREALEYMGRNTSRKAKSEKVFILRLCCDAIFIPNIEKLSSSVSGL